MQIQTIPSEDTADNAASMGLIIPQLVLKPSWHPDHETVERRLYADDWPYLLSHFGNEQAAKRFLSQRVYAYGALCYPHTAKDRIYSIERMMNVITAMDDVFTKLRLKGSQAERDRVHSYYMGTLDGTPPPPDAPLARLFYETIELVRKQLVTKPGVWQRLRASISDQLTMQAEAMPISTSTMSLEQYLELRRIDGFGYWITLATEYALDVDMESALESYPALVEVRHTTINSVMFVNDLFSLRKESVSQEPFNAAWFLMRDNKLDAKQALRRLSSLCELNEQKLIDATRRVMTGKLGARPDVQAYMAELGHLSSGNMEWHTFSRRYATNQN